MSQMTRKQVAEFVDNDANWTIIPGNDYVRIATLDFGSLHYAVTFTKSLRNVYEVHKHDATPKYSWSRDHYFEYEPEAKGLVYSVSNTLIKDRIYEEAKKNGDNKIQD